jgi:hypothetical protein
MKSWKLCVGSVVGLLGITTSAQAQLPGVPAAPPGAAAAAPAAVSQAASGTRTLWDFLGCGPEAKQRCLQRFCECPLGGLVNNMLRPMAAFTGGIIGPICPTVPSDEALRKLKEKDPTGAEAAAAEVQKSEAEAKARAAAVRYLGTVDCSRFEGVDDALIKALLFDPNECVRWEAAKALQNGCCCNKKTIDALAIVAAGQGGKVKIGGEEKVVPIEKCARVREAAALALEHCVACFRDTSEVKQPEKQPDAPTPTPAPQPDRPAAVLGQRPMKDTMKDAEEVLKARRAMALPPSGSRGVLDLVNASMKTETTATVQPMQPVQPMQVVQQPRLVPVPQANVVVQPTRPATPSPMQRMQPVPVAPQQAKFMQPSPQHVQPIYPAQAMIPAQQPQVQVIFEDQPPPGAAPVYPTQPMPVTVVPAPADNSLSGKFKNMFKPTSGQKDPSLDQRMFNLLNQSSGSTKK